MEPTVDRGTVLKNTISAGATDRKGQSITSLRSILLRAKNNDSITIMDTKCNIVVKLLFL